MIRKAGPLRGAHLFRKTIQKVDSLPLPARWLEVKLAKPRALLAHPPPPIGVIIQVLPSITSDRDVSTTLPFVALADLPLSELLRQAQLPLIDFVLLHVRIPK